jgi:hypothetical protein
MKEPTLRPIRPSTRRRHYAHIQATHELKCIAVERVLAVVARSPTTG